MPIATKCPPDPGIDTGKLIDTLSNRQTQYYTLWGFYTVVQFAVAGFGSTEPLKPLTVAAILCGVWAFNLGHLAFIVACVSQLNRLTHALDAALDGDEVNRGRLTKEAFRDMHVADLFWKLPATARARRGYVSNSLVHLFIDVAASLALYFRMPGH